MTKFKILTMTQLRSPLIDIVVTGENAGNQEMTFVSGRIQKLCTLQTGWNFGMVKKLSNGAWLTTTIMDNPIYKPFSTLFFPKFESNTTSDWLNQF